MWYKCAVLLAVISTVSGLKTGSFCYGSSALSCTSHTLSCGDGYVMSVATAIFGTKDPSYGCSPGNICNGDPNCCRYQKNSEKRVSLPLDMMNSIQQNCTYQQTCTLNLPYIDSPEYHFVYYNYECIKKSAILSMMCKDSVTTSYESYMFYFGKQRNDNLNISCSCDITSESPTVTLYTRYIQLGAQTCPSFGTSLSSLKLDNCSATGLSDTFRFVAHLPTPIHMPVDKLAAHPEDIFWLRFRNNALKALTIKCTGCGVDVQGACGKTVQISQNCYGSHECKDHPIQCKDGSVIALSSTTMYRGNRYYVSPVCQKATCNAEPSCCNYENQDKLQRFDPEELAGIFKECMYKQSCITTPQYSNPGNATYAYYRYECIPETSIINVMTPSSVVGFGEAFLHYNGSSRTPGTKMDCKCRITSTAATVTITTYQFILHPDTCCQLNISSSDTVIPSDCNRQSGVESFATASRVSSVPIDVHMNNILTRPGDVAIIRFNSGQGVNVDCDGCTEIPDTENDVCIYPEVGASTGNDESETDTIAIAAGVVGGLLLIALLVLVIWRCKRSKSKQTLPTDF